MRRLIFLYTLLILGAGSAMADDYPSHPIRLIVPFAPGGAVDPIARLIANPLGERLGKPIVIYDRGGAGGSIGMDEVAKSPPDGYTLLLDHSGMTYMPGLYRTLPFDPVKDFAGIITAVAGFYVLAVNNDLPVKSVAELIAYAKANPGKLNYGAVIGTPPHMCGEMFKHITGANIVFVPYKTASQATIDVLAGQMNMTFEGTTAIVPHIKSGEVRALAVTSPTRIPEIPDVPTMDELGYPGMPPDSWQAIVAPAGTPAAVVAKINKVVNEGLATPELQNKLKQLGGEPQPKSVADFAAFIADQYKRWGEVIRITGVTLN